MRLYWKYYIVPVIYGIIFSWYAMVSSNYTVNLTDTILYLGGGPVNSINGIVVASILEQMVPYMLFVILFTPYIYQHFCKMSPYIFSRCKHRGRWFFQEVSKLFGLSFLYVIAILFGGVCMGLCSNQIVVDLDGLRIAIHFIMTMTIWLFLSTLLANVVAMCFGSNMGVFVSIGLNTASVIGLLSVDEENLIGGNMIRFICNPSSYLMISWHSLKIENVEVWNYLKYPLSFYVGYLYFLGLSVIVIVIGYVMVQKMEILGNYKN